MIYWNHSKTGGEWLDSVKSMLCLIRYSIMTRLLNKSINYVHNVALNPLTNDFELLNDTKQTVTVAIFQAVNLISNFPSILKPIIPTKLNL